MILKLTKMMRHIISIINEVSHPLFRGLSNLKRWLLHTSKLHTCAGSRVNMKTPTFYERQASYYVPLYKATSLKRIIPPAYPSTEVHYSTQ